MSLIVFGDSFVSHERKKDFSFPFWTEQLAEKLDVSLVVHGKGGTNLNWSLLNYHNYIKNDYNEEDIILFVVTSGSRLPYVHPDFNTLNAFNWQTQEDQELLTAGRMWVKFYNEEIHQAHTYLLRQALENLPNTTMMLSGFRDSTENNRDSFSIHVGGAPLIEISLNEISLVGKERDRNRVDPRANHFHELNHRILADDLYSMLTDKKDWYIDKTEYMTKEKIQNA